MSERRPCGEPKQQPAIPYGRFRGISHALTAEKRKAERLQRANARLARLLCHLIAQWPVVDASTISARANLLAPYSSIGHIGDLSDEDFGRLIAEFVRTFAARHGSPD